MHKEPQFRLIAQLVAVVDAVVFASCSWFNIYFKRIISEHLTMTASNVKMIFSATVKNDDNS